LSVDNVSFGFSTFGSFGGLLIGSLSVNNLDLKPLGI